MPRTPPFYTLNTAHNPDPAETYNAVHPRVRSREVWPEQLERQQADKREHARPGRLTRRVWKDKHCFGGGVGDDAVPRSTRHAGREREERGGRRRERRESVNNLRNRRCKMCGRGMSKGRPAKHVLKWSTQDRHSFAFGGAPRSKTENIVALQAELRHVTLRWENSVPEAQYDVSIGKTSRGKIIRRNSAGKQCGETARRANRRLPPRKRICVDFLPSAPVRRHRRPHSTVS